MTTISQMDELMLKFDRKSPRDSYKQICDELGVRMQKDIYTMLPDKTSAWHCILVLDLSHTLLGTKGCMSLLPIITLSTALRKIDLRTCGLSDDFVIALCNIAQSHPSLRSIDISENDLVTVYSAPHIISVLRSNKNVVFFDVFKTHLGDNVAQIVEHLAQWNQHKVRHYFQDRYFEMKNLFSYMDADGTGWVPLKSLVLSCPYPVLQEQFMERIAARRPRKRSDNTVELNAFLQLVYMNYKTESDITRAAANTVDAPYAFIIANWKRVIAAAVRYNERSDVDYRLCLPDDLHRWRQREYLLLAEDADALIECAVQLTEHSDPVVAVATVTAFGMRNSGEVEASKMTHDVETRKPLMLTAATLLRAARSTLVPPRNLRQKPSYAFYDDRDVAHVPELLRNGSRTFSLGGMSALLGAIPNASEENMVTDTAAAVVGASTGGQLRSSTGVFDGADPPRTFSLTPSMVRMIVSYFERKATSASSSHRVSSVPDTPRRRHDRAMERPFITIPEFFRAEFVTLLEKLRPRLLADAYARHGFPVEEGTITLQEMVNLLDEVYEQCRVDRIFTLDEVKAMPDPMTNPDTRAVLLAHLEERDEHLQSLEPCYSSNEL